MKDGEINANTGNVKNRERKRQNKHEAGIYIEKDRDRSKPVQSIRERGRMIGLTCKEGQ